MRNYKDLQVWSKAHNLTLAIYAVTRSFPADERFGITGQIRRASVSIGANLAEGCGRRSDGELGRFVQIAMGSAAELSYHLLVARDLRFLRPETYDRLYSSLDEIMRMFSSFYDRVRPRSSTDRSATGLQEQQVRAAARAVRANS